MHRYSNIHASVRVLSDKGVGSWTGLKQPPSSGQAEPVASHLVLLDFNSLAKTSGVEQRLRTGHLTAGSCQDRQSACGVWDSAGASDLRPHSHLSCRLHQPGLPGHD